MRIWNGIFLGLAGLVLSGAAAQAQEYGYYRYFGPGPAVAAPYSYAPPPPYFVPPPPPPRYFYPPQPFYSYAEPEYPYAYAPPPRGYREPYPQPDYGFAPPPLPRKRETPPASAAVRPKDKTAAIAPSGPVSCTKAEEIVVGYGFGNVKPVTCAGKLFDFSALRDGKTYRVQVSAATGEITEVRKQP